ncbi:MAG: hypothetical protein R3B36_12790 [Polyangiaceae bacterium]
MTALRFASVDALRFTVTSGLVPDEVLRAPARVERHSDGAIVVAPDVKVTKRALEALRAAVRDGVDVVEPASSAARVGCWAELVPMHEDPSAEAGDGLVLFVAEGGAALVDLAGELLRLGCDRLEYRLGTLAAVGSDDPREVAFLRVVSPPYFSLVRAMDRVDDLRAFVPSPRGQDRVFVEVGHEHPLARLLSPAEGDAVLLSPDRGFHLARGGEWRDMYTIVELTVPGARVDEPPRAPVSLPRLEVPLRLARAGAVDAPTLWVLRGDAVARVEALLRTLPDELAHALLFAAVDGDDGPTVVLRARAGPRAPTLELDGEAYRAHPAISNLFIPCDALLEPPVRRDRLRELLSPSPDVLTWTRALSGGAFAVERVADAAFKPLTDWVEYVVDRAGPELDAWVKSARFDFDAFVGVDADLSGSGGRDRAEGDEDEPAKPRARSRREPERAPSGRGAARPATSPTPRTPAKVDLSGPAAALGDAATRLADKEREMLSMDAAPDARERSMAWADLGALYAEVGQKKDATLAWSRAVFELPLAEARGVSEMWCAADDDARGGGIPDALGAASPSTERVRALASLVIRDGLASIGGHDLASRAQDLTVLFDRHDEALDTRTAWLVRVALSRAVGGDRLGLARARDRMLSRLRGGLSIERDVPSLLRMVGGGRDAAQVDALADRLERLVTHAKKVKRKRSATEAPVALTLAYVTFVVASGLARLGRSDRARALVAEATRAVDQKDKVHAFLSSAFTARVEQALEGLPPETALPPHLSALLNDLGKLERYKVDRVRQYSTVLEPHERLDPIAAFQRGEADPRGPEFAALRGLADGAEVERHVQGIMAKAKASEPDERARLYDGVMDFFPMLVAERAREHLEEITGSVDDVPPLRRAQLLEEALMLAGHLGDHAFARSVFARLEPLVLALPPDSVADVAPVFGGTMRTLRRVGLREEARALLSAIQRGSAGERPEHVVARLHASAALAYLGDLDLARPVFEQVLGLLQGEVPVPARLQMTRACAKALASAPFDVAVAGLDALWPRLDAVTDSFNTNSHVCLSVVDYVESLVLGYASEDLVLGPEARQWLDEDEYLLRRRIHRDTAAG